ncbi:MAG TPA: 5-oxoprolinase subunit PxpB [Planctomycetota bacterium]|nr:5-oxoprolinase subunit PxpB [Planctomycetota bacterium]
MSAGARVYPNPRLAPLGDAAIRIGLGEGIGPNLHRRVRAARLALDRAALPGVLECVPSYEAVTVFYRPTLVRYRELERALEAALMRVEEVEPPAGRVLTIPVRYGGEWGPDLEFVASTHGLTAAEAIELHRGPTYRVYMIGFAPGFPYLGDLPERLWTPRLGTPRRSVPAGSVGIGGAHTGVYPLETPGGWRILGRTPVRLYDPRHSPPALLAAEDSVRFRPVGTEEHLEIEERVRRGSYRLEFAPDEGGRDS